MHRLATIHFVQTDIRRRHRDATLQHKLDPLVQSAYNAHLFITIYLTVEKVEKAEV